MKTRIITAVVGLAVLAVVLAFFDTILFDLVLAAICLLGIHEVFTAMGFGKSSGTCMRQRCRLPCCSCSAPAARRAQRCWLWAF